LARGYTDTNRIRKTDVTTVPAEGLLALVLNLYKLTFPAACP